jgi:hypothetical protein
VTRTPTQRATGRREMTYGLRIPDNQEASELVVDWMSRSLTQENFNAEAEDT